MIEIWLVIGFILDLILGDPYYFPHPVKFIGKFISFGEKFVRKLFHQTPKGQFISGTILYITVIFIFGLLSFILLYTLRKISIYFEFLAQVYFCYSMIAVKCLKDESMKVYFELKNQNIKGAKKKLSYIVGRDTINLNKEQIINAVVETVSENTSDGVIAPLFYMTLGGFPFIIIYKVINTFDSMIGYKNEKYIYFGKTAAKIDDIANFIPSRLSAVFMIIAVYILKYDYKNAVKIFKRDRFKHASPNSAQTESVCAGALGLKLGGDAYYFGKLYKKEYIGDGNKKSDIDDIIKVNKILYVTSFIAIIFFVSFRLLLLFLWRVMS